ncbi:MAG: class I SAM-dependent methyltransferase [Elusimicrobiota bacterium]
MPQLFRCPQCRNHLLHKDSAPAEALRCDACSVDYPIVSRVPRFVSSDNYAASFGMQWAKHARTQIDKFNGLNISRQRFFSTTGWPANMTGQKILEAGSGAGRFTQIACETGAEVYSFDYSSAVETNAANNSGRLNLRLFQADIYRMPLPPESFDKIFCFGMLQHTPDPERAFKSLIPLLRPGGEIVVDVYRKSIPALISWKYLLRPLTKRIPKDALYAAVSFVVPILIPIAGALRKAAGRAGARLVPIAEYSHLGIPRNLNQDWAILDTFDMYAPEHDHPQSLATIKRWFCDAGLSNVQVRNGFNGVIGRGVKPNPA